MARNIKPLELGLLKVTDEQAKYMKKITETTIFAASTKNFHPEGLFSTEIYGLQGSDTRMNTFALIDLKVDHVHPIVFKLLTRAKVLYANICSGRTYAVFNKKTKDFEESEGKKARTGYSFFIEFLPKLVISRNGSSSRDELHDIVNKYRKQLRFRYLPVFPAGMRDYTVDESDMPSVDGVNDIYRKIVNVAGFVDSSKINLDSLNSMLYAQQENLQELDEYIDTIILGKSKFHNSRVLRRSVHSSTRTVITSLQYDFKSLDDPTMVKSEQTVVGLFQYMKGTELKTIYDLTHGYLKNLFPSDQGFMYLTNEKTWLVEKVDLDTDLYKSYMTYDGLNVEITKMFAKENRVRPLKYKKYIFGLVYEQGDEVWIVQSKEELPEGYDAKKVTPLTFFLMAYADVYITSTKLPAAVSRYPVLSEGGIYPCFIYLKVTSAVRVMKLHTTGHEHQRLLGSYPVWSSGFFNSMSVSDTNLAPMGGDFDGDKCSFIPLLSNDSIKEVRKTLDSASYYLGVDGRLFHGPNDFVAEITLKTFTQ